MATIDVLPSIYFVGCLCIIGFQVALILGAPWGRITQGGQTDGSLPMSGRIVAGVSIALLLGMGLSILSAGGLWPHWPRWTVWPALAVQSLSALLNWITPSRPERKLWGPIMTGMLILAVCVILGRYRF